MLGIHKVILTYANGEIFIDSKQKIKGFQIHFAGAKKLGFDLPEGWLYDSNETQIIAVSLDNYDLKSDKGLIFYTGNIDIGEATFVFDDLTTQTIKKTSKFLLGQENTRGYIDSQTDKIKDTFGKVKISNVGVTKISDYNKNNKPIENVLRYKNKKTSNKKEIIEKYAEKLTKIKNSPNELNKYMRSNKTKSKKNMNTGGSY